MCRFLRFPTSQAQRKYVARMRSFRCFVVQIELSLVVLIGPSGCGKSSFARAHFKPTEVLSSDFGRGLVSNDENAQAATKDAFEVLHFVARKRLAAGRLTVVDATNVQPDARKPLVALAREFHVLPVAIVLTLHGLAPVGAEPCVTFEDA